MKYVFFSAAVIAILPAVTALLCQQKWIRWTMLGLFLPVLMFNSTAINFFSNEFYRGTSRGMEISIIYIVATIILLTITFLKGPQKLFPDTGSKLYLLYFLLCLPSLQHADNRLFSFFELWKMCMIYLVFLAVFYYLEYSKGDFDILLYGIMIVVGFNFLTIVRQHFSGIYQVPGVFPHQNSMAMYMQLIGIILFSRYFNLKEGRRSRLFMVTSGLAVVSMVRTYSRGALACFPIVASMTLLCSIWYKFTVRKIYIIIIFAFIGLAGLLVFLPKIIDRFENAPESSGKTRKNLAIAALNMMKHVPWSGVGINNWGIKINPPYEYSQHRDTLNYGKDHKEGIVETIYLLVGAECGVPGLCCLLLWFAYYWFTALRLAKILRRTDYFYLPAGALGGMTGIFLQSCLEWVLKQQINFMLLVIVFAMISYLNKHARELARAAAAPPPSEKTNEVKA